MSEAAAKLRDQIHKAARKHMSVIRAEVTSITDGITVERLDSMESLDQDDDFDLTWTVRKYDADVGIAVGDTLLMHHESGHYVAFDVLSDADLI